MTKITKFIVYHDAPEISWEKVEENWRKLANVEEAKWLRTYYNKEKGVRYCIWLASSEEELREIFNKFAISLETIVEVEETVPDLWGKKRWKEHLAAESEADTLAF
ncbi:MAG: DUF4242 domain-containing protein [Deltaproteobacteria bacterium]|jgi:hypothetical protein|nr:DUF4242 domain-containing protein [Deltaproteobacteria bacterium]MBW2491351.1 DUF4242 domain-containing protein [Deltaproteobacteria bacterium]